MVNWLENSYPFKNFTEELTREWEECGFKKSEAGSWLKANLKATDANFAQWLKDIKNIDIEWFLEEGDDEELRKEHNQWLSNGDDEGEEKESENIQNFQDYIHSQFLEFWEKEGFNYKESKEWVNAGLGSHEFKLASWLKNNETSPQEFSRNFKGKKRDAQEWIDYFYPKEKRKEIIELIIIERDLEGVLTLNDFVNLGNLECSGNKISTLDVSCCENLVRIYCHNFKCFDNQLLTTLILPKEGKKLRYLELSHNQPTDLTIFSHLTNLIRLCIDDNLFSGNLEPLKRLEKLSSLNIEKTEITPTWEHLPKIKRINIFNLLVEDPHIDKINQELIPYRQVIYDPEKYSPFFFYNLVNWRQDQSGYQSLKQTLFKINPKLDAQDFINQFEFFNVKTGFFQGNLQNINFLFSRSQENIDLLTSELIKLTGIIKEQKEKIIQAYLRFAPEKELLQEVIQVKLELSKLTKAKGESKEISKLSSKFRKLNNELANKLEESENFEAIADLETVLSDCDKIADAELELVTKFGLAIEYDQQNKTTNYYFITGQQIVVGNSNSSIYCSEQITNNYGLNEEQFQKLTTKLSNIEQGLESKNQTIKQESEKQINELAHNQTLTESEKQLIKKSLNLLTSKKIFINIRQGTIQNLQTFYNNFEKYKDKTEKITFIGSLISSIGEGVNLAVPSTGAITKSVNKAISLGVDAIKDKKWKEYTSLFKECLIKDKESIDLFAKFQEELYQTLHADNNLSQVTSEIAKILKLSKNKISSFGEEHSMIKVSKRAGFWGTNKLDLVLLREVIKVLHNDLEKFKKDLELEEGQLLRKPWFENKYQAQIEVLPK